jgi:2-oxo-4-hydroxy-4-carboxy--5-ureidoimidazoline (OHCU) decarboxylase
VLEAIAHPGSEDGTDEARRYATRFGHPFVICREGVSTDELAGALRSRMANDPVAERRIVRIELSKIVRLNLARSFQ